MHLENFNSGRLPSERILKHSKTGCYAIVHFTLNTWTDQEWGYGDESPDLFNPDDFNADTLVQNCIDGNLDGLILVCKHHQGFCLWPSKTTEYNISKAPYKGGKGDVVKEVVEACRRHGLKFGFYISPWDRNSKYYGTPEYVKIFREQLREVYSQYGDAFECWYDGANGGDGYYGGAREKRKIDPSVYYDWDNTWKLARELEPNAVFFSDIGPDVRWCSNEAGFCGDDSVSTFTPVSPDPEKDPAPGYVKEIEGLSGHVDGKWYMPPECDFPLRPGWFYHPGEDGKTRTPDQLLDIYLHTVGNGGFFNIGLAPNTHGRLTDEDVAALKGFKAKVDALYANPIANGDIKPNDKGEIRLDFPAVTECSFVDMAEPTDVEEVIRDYELCAVKADGTEEVILSGKAIGFRRLRKFAPVECKGLVLRIKGAVPKYVRMKAYK